MIDTKNLTLYYFYGCPFCAKVMNFLKKNNILVPMKNTYEDAGAKAELIRIGGKSQVPCLVIDGKALYESDDIIEWFREKI